MPQEQEFGVEGVVDAAGVGELAEGEVPVSYTHLRAHETVLDLVCRLLLEKKNYHQIVLNLQTLQV